MASGIIPTIKRAAVEAVEAANPADVIFGKVVGTNPLKVRINSSIVLTQNHGVLKLSRNVTDYTVDISVNWETENVNRENGNDAISHFHDIKGTKRITVHNALKMDDTVIMIKAKGGQSFVILDKVGD